MCLTLVAINKLLAETLEAHTKVRVVKESFLLEINPVLLVYKLTKFQSLNSVNCSKFIGKQYQLPLCKRVADIDKESGAVLCKSQQSKEALSAN